MIFFFLFLLMAMVALALILVLPSLTGKFRWRDVSRKESNIEVARQQLAELDELEKLNQISAEDAAAQRAEIEVALVEDVEGSASESHIVKAEADVSGRWMGVFVCVAVPVVAIAFYIALGNPTAVIPPEREEIVASSEAPSVEVLVERLKIRLENDPTDAEGWFRLGQTMMLLGDPLEAVEAFSNARAIEDSANLMILHADALVMSGDGTVGADARELIMSALELEPDHPTALSMAGMAARNAGDINGAVSYWRRAQEFLEGSDFSRRLDQLIAEAEAGKSPGASAEIAIEVNVSLIPDLNPSVSPEDTLYVLARPVDGGSVPPIAVVRRRAGDLPLSVILDTDTAMIPGRFFSSSEPVEILARITRSGNPQVSSGDLSSEPFQVLPNPNGSTVVVTVNTILP